jgi:hypothetical protein
MAALDTGASFNSFRSQSSDKFWKFHPVVAALKAHLTIQAGPDRLVFNLRRPFSPTYQALLDNKARIEICIVLGYRTDYCALAAIQAKPDLGVLNFLFKIRQFIFFLHRQIGPLNRAGPGKLVEKLRDTLNKTNPISMGQTDQGQSVFILPQQRADGLHFFNILIDQVLRNAKMTAMGITSQQHHAISPEFKSFQYQTIVNP